MTIDLTVPKLFLKNPDIKLANKAPKAIVEAANASSFFCTLKLFSSLRSFGPAGALQPEN